MNATERVDLTALFPYRDGERPEAWTDRVLPEARTYGTYRQCSIGWHEECSQRGEGSSAECACLCHAAGAEIYSVEGHAEGGVVTVLRVEQGKHFWPPQEGEPETMWAWWILALSPEDAAVRGAAKEAKMLQEQGL